MTADNFCFYLQNRLIHTSKTGGQRYSDTFPFSIPSLDLDYLQNRLIQTSQTGGQWYSDTSLFITP
jgi:hypothetical protein